MTKEQERKIQSFLGYCLFHYKNTKFEFVPTKKLKIGSIECTGEAVKGRLTIATGGDTDNWLQVFLHETCHLDQRIERPKWFDSRDNLVTELDRWLSKEIGAKDISWNDIAKIVELEHDCEARSLQKIKDFGLPINLEEYAQKANSYLASYANTFKDRKWDSAPYTDPKRWKAYEKELLPLEHYTYFAKAKLCEKYGLPRELADAELPEM
jgi:hypothetical protein